MKTQIEEFFFLYNHRRREKEIDRSRKGLPPFCFPRQSNKPAEKNEKNVDENKMFRILLYSREQII